MAGKKEKDDSSSKLPSDHDEHNPLYIHHADSPTAVLVSLSLTGDNYSTWVSSLSMDLRAKNKLGFVTGDISKPSAPSQIPQWERCNDLVNS